MHRSMQPMPCSPRTESSFSTDPGGLPLYAALQHPQYWHGVYPYQSRPFVLQEVEAPLPDYRQTVCFGPRLDVRRVLGTIGSWTTEGLRTVAQ